MIIRKSLKQLFRTPLTTTLFIVLMTAASFFLCAGVVIWARNQATIKAYENTFMTIGTVEQRSDSMIESEKWDAYAKTHMRQIGSSYNIIYDDIVLSFDGDNYIINPQKRPFYGAWCPDFKLWADPNLCIWDDIIIEFTPVEDCVPSEPVDVIIKWIAGDLLENNFYTSKLYASENEDFSVGAVIKICDHENDAPEKLYAGKTYIACLNMLFHDPLYTEKEFRVIDVAFSTQYASDGTQISLRKAANNVQEVYDGFYETEEGQLWLNYADAMYKIYKTVPVLPTGNTELLIPFYNRSSFIIEGEDISEEEYEAGEYVCLISSGFADMNVLSVGDTIKLPLYYADCKNTPANCFSDLSIFNDNRGGVFDFVLDGSPLNADGKPYEVFSDHEYTIKGIYFNTPSNNSVVSIGGNVIIVPSKSIRESDENNILAWGPMTDANTSFQIPNGSIESFMEKWLQQPHAEDFQLTFYDRGYTQVQRGIANMKRMSTLFLTIGGVLALVLVLYFSNMFITKNKSRTAIERMLGYTKRQCAVSLLSGFMLCALIAAVLGCGVSMVFEDKLTDSLLNKEYYDTTFTIGAVDMDVEVEAGDSGFVAFACPAAGVLLLAVTFGIGCLFMRGNLKEEPLVMLGKKVE